MTSAAAELPGRAPNLRFAAYERVALSACKLLEELWSFIEGVPSPS